MYKSVKNYRYQFWGKITLIIRTNVSSLLKEKISLFVGELFSLVKCEIKQSTIDKTLTKLLKKMSENTYRAKVQIVDCHFKSRAPGHGGKKQQK